MAGNGPVVEFPDQITRQVLFPTPKRSRLGFAARGG
jgi:hypothetical protein